jgi:sulfate/thiosulfate transport system ATP-binding protein
MSIVLADLTKLFHGARVVDRVGLEVANGELFVLLGASGSGKSTILRLIAGLARADGGTIHLHGRDVTLEPPQSRGVGLVFQNYSIFRHMSVAENVEFGLKIRGTPPAERVRRREELLDLIGLGGLGNRYADQLSGGQQQRVALARALAYEPSILLLDEPFGALDVKIRAQLRQSLKEVQQKLGVTTILVTHDQEEGFELGNRIGVIERGRLLEVGEPEDLYFRPRTSAVATFLGSGTLLVGRCKEARAHFGPLVLPIPPDVPHEDGARVRVLFRPEQVELFDDEPEGKLVLGRGEIVQQSFAGPLRRLRLRLEPLSATRQIAPAPPYGETGLLVDAAVPSEKEITTTRPWVAVREWHVLRRPAPRILVCEPAAETSEALTMGGVLERALDGALTVLGVAPGREGEEPLRATLASRLKEVGFPATSVRVRHGDRSEAIAQEQEENVYDFVVLGSEGAHGDRLDPVVETLLGRMVTPLLFVKREASRPERILVCTAVGEPGKADIRVGGWIARQLGARVTLLHVANAAGEPPLWVRSHLERGVATLRTLDVESEFRIRPAASPIEGIRAEETETAPGLIVIGGHGPRSRALFGDPDDVTRQVLRAAERPVLVVPENT